MLTPQEVSEQSFTKASFGGYQMAQVDEFLDVLTKDYSALYSENAVLKSKLKVLVDKVEEYRATEDAMRKALMSAQRMAEDMVKEAEQKRAEILKDAEEERSRRKSEMEEAIKAEEYRLNQAQRATASFVEQVRALYARQDALLNGLKDLVPNVDAPLPTESERVERAADEIESSIQRLLDAQAAEQAQPDAAGTEQTTEFPAVRETAPAQEGQDSNAGQKGPIPFANLQFGRDYQIK